MSDPYWAASRICRACGGQSDPTEPEFEALVKALARRFEGEPFDESAFPPDRQGER